MVVVSAAMVGLAAVLLALHLVTDRSGLALVYPAMALAVGSMAVLQLAKRRRVSGAHLARGGARPRLSRTADAGAAAVAPTTIVVAPSAIVVDVESPPPDNTGFPISDYEALAASQVLPLLESLDDRQLEQVAGRERAGRGRRAILEAIAEIGPAQRWSMLTETASPSTTSR